MSDKEKLRDMLDNLINNKAEDAQVNFHQYLQGKMQNIINPQDEEVPAEPEKTEE